MPTSEPAQLILRFRDLVTPRGGTIREHADKIAQYHYVWWGWWNKQGEQVPVTTFTELSKSLKRGSVPLLLFDSGTSQLYNASCTDIKWDPSAGAIPSPDPQVTPEYYKSQQYFAWFRFEELDTVPVDLAQLQRYSYHDVPEFFTSGRSAYGAFEDKRIASGHELVQQNRTIWFVRPFRTGDRVHEVSLLDARQLQPADFQSGLLESSATRLLWLSDTHFGPHHEFPASPQTGRETLATRLEAAVKKHFPLRPDESLLGGAILSGDLTWSALKGEFAQATEFLAYTRSWANFQPYHLAICPGNHDIAFSSDPSDPTKPVTDAGPASRQEFDNFYEQQFYVRPNPYLSSGRRFLLGGVSSVEVVTLNSSLLQNIPNAFQGNGFVGEAQLEHAATAMKWHLHLTGRKAFRVLVLHHHILPVTYREVPYAGIAYSVVLDAEAILRWAVTHRIDVILHGHMHQPFYSRLVRPRDPDDPANGTAEVTVVGLGSAGVALTDLGELKENVFGMLDFRDDKVQLTIATVHPTNESKALWSITLPYST